MKIILIFFLNYKLNIFLLEIKKAIICQHDFLKSLTRKSFKKFGHILVLTHFSLEKI